MKIGVCCGFDNIAVAAECGYDYIETNFRNLAESSEEEYEKFRAELITNNITCEAANCFLPGSMKVTGENTDYDAIKKYLSIKQKHIYTL